MAREYQCCFCGLGIESEVPDIASLWYTTTIDRDVTEQQSQCLFCHTKCLRGHLHPSVKLYAAFLAEHPAIEGEGEWPRSET
jgi:hypothetical protein